MKIKPKIFSLKSWLLICPSQLKIGLLFPVTQTTVQLDPLSRYKRRLFFLFFLGLLIKRDLSIWACDFSVAILSLDKFLIFDYRRLQGKKKKHGSHALPMPCPWDNTSIFVTHQTDLFICSLSSSQMQHLLKHDEAAVNCHHVPDGRRQRCYR